MGHIVGIDLGTTNSLVAFVRGERPEIIPNEAGKRLTPSMVGLDRHNKLHVGETAKNQYTAMPERTVAEVKRLMGTSQKVKLGEREYTPQEISGIILKQLKDDAEKYLGSTIAEAVITVPAYFTDAQRQATKDAGELAGFKVDRILNEPTAAALAYGLDNLDKEQYVLVYDLGGGTFDVSVLEMFEGVLDVKASAGNNHLGGGDFDRRIVEFLVKQFERDHGVDVSRDLRAMARLKQAAEDAKMQVSSMETTTILLPFLAARGAEPLNLECEFSREQFELLVEDQIKSTIEPIETALRDAKLDKKQISEVVLVGGSSRIPMVKTLLQEYFGKEARRGVNPDEAIALGAAVQAGLKSGQFSSERGIMITDVCPFTLGVEVVASTGYQKMSGMFSPIIPRNSTIPVSRTEQYSTTADNQRLVDIKVYQGESRLVKNNTFLGEYTVDGIPPAPAGQEKVAITFTYDVNGLLGVTTRIVSTGKDSKLTIEKSSQRMSDQERNQAKARLDKEWEDEGAAAGGGAARPSGGMGGGGMGGGGMGGGMGGMGGGMGGGGGQMMGGGMGGGMGGMGGGMGGMGGGMGGMGGGGMGGMFSVPPEKIVSVNLNTVCLEHGKDDPNVGMRYRLLPLSSVSQDPVLSELLAAVGTGKVDRQAAQAAAWHRANNMSWPQLAAKDQGVEGSSSYFSAEELAAAAQLLALAEQQADYQHDESEETEPETSPRVAAPKPARVSQLSE